MNNKKLNEAGLTLTKWAIKLLKTRVYREDYRGIEEAIREILFEANVITVNPVNSFNPLNGFVRVCIDSLQNDLRNGPRFRVEYDTNGGVREFVNAADLVDLIARALFIASAADGIEDFSN